ncbi:DUF2169 family type VI secretion system accessory protein [Hyalangium minutum]|uniref:DUF2169 domain-containing protein n=1 Tax=Hyalangium minutum TaxID=394096 RepID=A0A085WS03_9BACT|nr:DUF2169 domain-containing protein [Hyalangium minutum]KFE70466.1 hypothetical protein DB31_5508 [Hyalangium minutum]
MDIVKDTGMELGYLVWQVRPPRPSLTVVAKATFALTPDGLCALAEPQHPVSGPVFYEDDPQRSMRLDTDLAVWKTRGECFLAGTCYPPGGKPAATSAVAFQVGKVSKALAVFGDRAWTSMGVLSAPKPFTAMPLCYERSFGGPGVDANPLGSAVPNIEDPRDLITSPRSRPKPVGAFPIPPDWKSRLKRAGRYDKKWLATRWPYFPEDFDGSFFNAAPEDQWIEGFWKGDEELVLQNLHPRHAVLRTRLPGLRARVFLMEKGTGFREVPLRLDTITVDADAGLAFVLWRGMMEVKTESLQEVDFIYLAHEPLNAPLSTQEHRARFEQKLAERDKEEEDFKPEAPPPTPEPPVMAAAPEAEPATLDPAELEAKLKKLIPLPPPEAVDPKASPPSAKSAKQLRKAFAAIGVEPTKELEALLAEMEDPGEATEIVPLLVDVEPRERLLRRLKAKESVAGEDWSGGDFSKMDLSRVDLTGAILQGCSLRGAKLDEAKLDGAVLAGSDLSEASLRKASLEGADLTGVRAAASRFDEANLGDATLSGGEFTGASFHKAQCKGAEFIQAKLTQGDLREACLDEADLSEARLEDARLEGASLQDTDLAKADASRANFDGANLSQLRASPGARMAQASFKRVQAAKSRWGGAMLDETDFSFSELARADFSGASLVKARFNGCNVPNSRFMGARMVGTSMLKANVFEGLFESADLSHADLRGANLFGAEFWKAQTASTKLELAILTRTKLADRAS